MKKLIFPIVCCFISMTVSAQLVKQQAETQKKQSELDWFNCSFNQDSVYGAEVNKAYDYLNANKKKAKKRPVVALIGTGMDVEHEDLKQAIWVNPKEKLNQKDDDKNVTAGLTVSPVRRTTSLRCAYPIWFRATTENGLSRVKTCAPALWS